MARTLLKNFERNFCIGAIRIHPLNPTYKNFLETEFFLQNSVSQTLHERDYSIVAVLGLSAQPNLQEFSMAFTEPPIPTLNLDLTYCDLSCIILSKDVWSIQRLV